MTKYIWKNRHQLGYVDPEIAAIELERIRKEHNGLRPPEIIQEARPEDAPLHPIFEWDDSKAAEQFRLGQARRLVKEIRVITDDTDKSEPVYVNISTEEGRKYEAVSIVVSDQDLFARALDVLRRNLDSAEDAFEELYNMADTKKREPLAKAFDSLQETRRIIEREVALQANP